MPARRSVDNAYGVGAGPQSEPRKPAVSRSESKPQRRANSSPMTCLMGVGSHLRTNRGQRDDLGRTIVWILHKMVQPKLAQLPDRRVDGVSGHAQATRQVRGTKQAPRDVRHHHRLGWRDCGRATPGRTVLQARVAPMKPTQQRHQQTPDDVVSQHALTRSAPRLGKCLSILSIILISLESPTVETDPPDGNRANGRPPRASRTGGDPLAKGNVTTMT